MYELLALDPERGLWDAAALVHLATLGYVFGFVLKNQIALRLLVLAATLAYIAYYYLHPETPLWGAIYGSVLILCANLIGLARILHGRIRFAMSEEHRAIFAAMDGLRPGEFRQLMRLGDIRRATDTVELTRQGEHPDRLFFVIEGAPQATKGGRRFAIPLGHFIGEISLILAAPATATVALEPGGVYVEWERDRLRRALAGSDEFRVAFEALLSRDMAAKVANSVQIERARADQGAVDPAFAALIASA